MRMYVNESCIGCGLCASTCPDVFSMTDDNCAKAIDTVLPEEWEPGAAEAMENCPVGAIEAV